MTSPNRFYTILVGVDYSEVSRLAIRDALRVAGEHGESKVHVLHVESALQPYLHAAPVPPTSVDELLARSLQRLERFVADELAVSQRLLRDAALSADRVISHVRMQAPGRELAQMAVDLGADLVVVGTHGRTGLARLLLGSVAHAVVTLAPCPVLVVREKRETSEAPQLEPACEHCIEIRQQTAGHELWCEQHRERHGQRHTYHQGDRVSEETNFPLVFDRH